MAIKIRKAFDRERVQTKVEGKSLTKQSMKDECDINRIMARYDKTGLLTHMAQMEPKYADVDATDFMDAMLIVKNAQEAFEELPSELRLKFGNDPANFLAFMDDPKNDKEAVELGLKRYPQEEPPVKVELTNPIQSGAAGGDDVE